MTTSNPARATASRGRMDTPTALPCLACGASHLLTVERHGNYRIRRCPVCGLQFSDPMLGMTSNYAEAYDRGGGPAEVAGEGLPFLGWTEEASPSLAEFPWFLTSAQQLALKLARRRFPPRSQVAALDIGFGAGWFLGGLHAAGFRAYGQEVADAPVNTLLRKGFPVCHSPHGLLPAEWPGPALITCFEVLEHLEDPAGFLSSLRQRHPDAEVMLSVPDERRWFLLGGREAHDYPPNHLTRWSPPALVRTLQKAGFRHVKVFRVRPTAQELSMAGVRRFIPFLRHGRVAGNAAPATSLSQELRKRQLRRLCCLPLAAALTVLSKTACSMLAVGSNRNPI
jgi:hypothetical protein